MEIFGTKVYDLEESILASGFPMRTEISPEIWENDVTNLQTFIHSSDEERGNHLSEEEAEKAKKHMKRAASLAGCKGGESHDCFLTGIVVSTNISASKKWWEEFQRYHFKEIISATSTMHRAGQMVSGDFSKLVEESVLKEPEIKAFFERKKQEYPAHAEDQDWLYSLRFCLPLGTIQTARVRLNYRSLKTIYHQRRNHRLKEWKQFCKWVEELPLAKELILSQEK